jgi:two-component system sensor histidine kinase BarA
MPDNTDAVTILLVDDDPHVAGVFELVMNHYHLPLTIMQDAESALNYLQDNNPDVVVMDLFLPGLDGYQALKQIRKSSLAPNAKFIATTAYYTHETEQDAADRGFDGYLPKPMNSNELVPYILSVAGRE